MYLYTIIAYAFLFWQGELPTHWIPFEGHETAWTLCVVIGQAVLIALVAFRVRWRLLRSDGAGRADSERSQHYYHRASFVLRCGVLAGFAATVFLTRWMDWFAWGRIALPLQILGDLVVLIPFVANFLIVWIMVYPAESVLRFDSTGALPGQLDNPPRWRFGAYLGFHLRHFILVAAVPLTLILFAAELTRGYDEAIISWTGWLWTPDALLAAVAFLVFLVAPAMLRRLWSTTPLAAGEVREQLERCAARIGMKYREILVWQTDGIMINAAAMGLLPRVRYVLLSDALLDTMNNEQVEAVFGHEAGHVRHHHIQYFLAFAVVGWVLVAALMELLAALATSLKLPAESSFMAIETLSVVVTLAFWGIGFGWVSRRFEWQADLFGAQCVTPQPAACTLPCSVHPDRQSARNEPGRVCMTGAAIFASALERVAALNGIPRDERSWRHSSIQHRVGRLFSLAGDAARAERFHRGVRRLQRVLVTVAVAGSIASVGYLLVRKEPAIIRLQETVERQAEAE